MTLCEQIGIVLQITTVSTFLFTSRKVWWPPIAGLLNQGICIAYALTGPAETRTLLPSIGMFSLIYMFAIPKWYKERKKGGLNIKCSWCGTMINSKGEWIEYGKKQSCNQNGRK